MLHSFEGGPPHVWKNQIFKTIFEHFLSRDNYTANISQSSVEVSVFIFNFQIFTLVNLKPLFVLCWKDGVSSETSSVNPMINVPNTEALTCSTTPEMFNYSLDASELQRLQYEMKREQSDDEAEEYFTSNYT